MDYEEGEKNENKECAHEIYNNNNEKREREREKKSSK
jgi:hypothetical protein